MAAMLFKVCVDQICVFRLTPASRPIKAGLDVCTSVPTYVLIYVCPSVCPSTKSFSDMSEIWCVARVR